MGIFLSMKCDGSKAGMQLNVYHSKGKGQKGDRELHETATAIGAGGEI